MQWLFKCGVEGSEIITIFSEDIPGLRAGAYRDAKTILQENDWLRKYYPESLHNKSDRIYKSTTGSEIEFKSFSDEIDARQGKRHRSFCNEANGVHYEVWEQVNIRTSIQSIIDFNPSARFWAHEKLEGRDDVEWKVSTFRDNRFLDKVIKQKILSYEPTHQNIARGTANEYRWLVYGLGQVGRLEGLVFPDFKVTSEWPDDYKWRVFGMDFGYKNDPTVLVEIRYHGGALYWKEHFYDTGLTNPDISEQLERVGHDRNEKIIADSSEPKSIEELRRMNWNVHPAEKGQDSIIHGIDTLNRYPLYINAKSKNLIEEFSSYTWDKDKSGNSINKPIDAFNHGIDAGRYAVAKKVLKDRPTISPSLIDF
jgi:phage terminase large subunit